MTLQYSAAVYHAKLNAIEAAIGTAMVVKLWTGAPPANVAAANTGTELASGSQPSDYFAAAGSGAVAKTGTWSVTVGAAGTVGHFRCYASNGTTAHMQGTVTATGGGGDMTMNNPVIAAGQISEVIPIDVFTITTANQ